MLRISTHMQRIDNDDMMTNNSTEKLNTLGYWISIIRINSPIYCGYEIVIDCYVSSEHKCTILNTIHCRISMSMSIHKPKKSKHNQLVDRCNMRMVEYLSVCGYVVEHNMIIMFHAY